jgi:serine protease AprX
MAELKIVSRLRFAVALSAALALLLILSARDAWGAEYIVQMDAGSAPSEGAAVVERLGGRVTSPPLDVINGFGASLDAADAALLEATAGVRAVSPNGGVMTSSHRTNEDTSGGFRCDSADATTKLPRRLKVKRGRSRSLHPLASLMRLGQPLQHAAGADRAWFRATGAGVGVAVIDTGIAGDLPDFRDPEDPDTSRVVATAVTNPCARSATDHFGHGTHVAGLIAGNSLLYPDHSLRGRYMGIAPDADLISVKTSDDDGNTTVLDVIYGIQFAVDHRGEFGIRVINLSLSSTVAESYLTDPLNAAVESAWLSGIVVVAAAGNAGTRSDAVSYAPGNDPFVITAGSTDDQGTWRTSDDVLARWSSRGLTQDGVSKPEVLAPGVRLVAALAPDSDFTEMCSACVVDGRYFRVSGTSMSAAVVSGVAALMLQKHPEWSPDKVKGAMVATLRDVPGAGGAVDAAAALDGSGTANLGLVPSPLVSPETGEIDWARASFRRASFRDAAGSPLDVSWSRASFRCDCSLLDSGEVDPSRSSFRAAGFQRTTTIEE